MEDKERIRDKVAFRIVNLFQATFKARLMDKLPLYRESLFCKGVYCYISSMVELRRSEREFLPDVQNWLNSFRPGEVFYDIGANIGMFSLTVAKIYNGQIKAYAFEPSFSTFGSLIRNVIGNRFEKIVIPFCIALGSKQGVRSFNYTDITSGASVHTLDTVVNQTGMEFNPVFSQQVISYALDDLVRNFGFPIPNHIKIDVDGGEREVVDGMQSVLGNPQVKSILIELTENNENDEQVQHIVRVLEKTGFKRTLDIAHSELTTYPRVFEILFTKDWNFFHE
jgi:FkbM family methyltransferase